MWAEICLLLLGFGYILHVWARTYWKRRGIFQFGGTFIFGNIKDILFLNKSLHTFTWDIYKKYKSHKFVGVYSFYSPLLIVTDPTAIRQIMLKEFISFAGPPIDVEYSVDPMMALSPFAAPTVETWKEWRGLHTALVSPSKLKAIPDLVLKIGQNMIKFINERINTPVKVKDITDFFTIDAVSSFTFGNEPTAFIDPENPFRKNARDEIFNSETTPAVNSFFLYPFVARIFRYRMVTLECQNFFLSFCKQMLKLRKTYPSNRLDFFEHIATLNMKYTQEGKKGFTELEVAGHAVNAYIDSFFTTSSAFSYFLLELSKRPDLQEKLRSEMLAIGKRIEDFDFEKINSLSLLQMAFTESLRLHPPVSVTARKCLKTTIIEGVKIEKGIRILLPISSLHKDSTYFPEPEKYMPERYLSEDSLVKGTLLPFGDGPRMCLGSRYATLITKLGTVYLLLNYNICPYGAGNKDEVFPFDTPDETAKIVFQRIV